MRAIANEHQESERPYHVRGTRDCQCYITTGNVENADRDVVVRPIKADANSCLSLRVLESLG